MASPTVQTTNESSTNTAGTNHTVSLPSGIVAGDLILIVMDIGSTSATLNAHADYSEALDEASANGLKVLYRRAVGGETDPTFVSSASTRDATISYRISGAASPTTRTPEVGTTATGSSTTPDPPAAVMTGGSKDYLVICFFGRDGEETDNDGWVTGTPTNYTNRLSKSCGTAGTNLGGIISAAQRQVTTSAENPGTFTANTGGWRAQTVTIHPDTMALWTATDNIAPTGVAFASATTTSQIVDGANNSTDNYIANLAAYTTAVASSGGGLSSDSVVVAAQAIARVGNSTTTSRNAGIQSTGNPTISETTTGTGTTAAATEPTGWTTISTSVSNFPTVTVANQPTVEVRKATASTDVMMADLLGMNVEYVPSLGTLGAQSSTDTNRYSGGLGAQSSTSNYDGTNTLGSKLNTDNYP